MKVLVLVVAVVITGLSVSNADPVSTCTNLVGTYAELETPDRPLLTVSFSNAQFSVVDTAGRKTIVDIIPTEKGLVFVENPRNRHVFRLSSSTNANVYVFERLGKHLKGTPLPEGPGHKTDMVRVQPASTDANKE